MERHHRIEHRTGGPCQEPWRRNLPNDAVSAPLPPHQSIATKAMRQLHRVASPSHTYSPALYLRVKDEVCGDDVLRRIPWEAVGWR